MLLVVRFYQLWLTEKQTIPVALNAAQHWLRTTRQAEMLAWAKSHLDATCEGFVRSALATYAQDPPFQSPLYWAAFCAVG